MRNISTSIEGKIEG